MSFLNLVDLEEVLRNLRKLLNECQEEEEKAHFEENVHEEHISLPKLNELLDHIEHHAQTVEELVLHQSRGQKKRKRLVGAIVVVETNVILLVFNPVRPDGGD